MRILLVLISMFFLGACAHHGQGRKSDCGSKSKCSKSKCSKKGNHYAKMWEKMDANKDGKISKAEWTKDKAEWFTKMDANKDGSITKEEKAEFMKNKHKHGYGKKGKDCKSCK